MGSNISMLRELRAQHAKPLPGSCPGERMMRYYEFITKSCVNVEIDESLLASKFSSIINSDFRLHEDEFIQGCLTEEEAKKRRNNPNWLSQEENDLSPGPAQQKIEGKEQGHVASYRQADRRTKKLNGLRLICSAVLFSDLDFTSKLNYLMRAFDFNQLHSLSKIDVELILQFCFIAAIRSLQSMKQPEVKDISQFVNQTFVAQQRLMLIDLINGLKDIPDVKDFCTILGIKPPNMSELNEIEHIYQREDYNIELPEFLHPDKRRKQFKYTDSVQILSDLNQNKASSSDSWSALLKLTEQQPSNKYCVDNLRLQLNWVYGFRCKESLRNCVYHSTRSPDSKDFVIDPKIIYFTANIVVLFYYKINKQKHYREHRNRVCSIALSKNNSFCATGDMGSSPEIHIWSPNTLQTHKILPCIPNMEVYLLEFVNEDQWITTASSRPDTPITVYDISSSTVVMAIDVKGFLLGLGSFVDTISSFKLIDPEVKQFKSFDVSSSFFAFTATQIYVFIYLAAERLYQLKIVDHEVLALNGQQINCCCAAIINSEKPYLTFSDSRKKFNLYLFFGLTDGRMIYLKFPSDEASNWTSSECLLENKEENNMLNPKPINHILFYKAPFVVIQRGQFEFHWVNTVQGESVFSFDFSALPIKYQDEKLSFQSVSLINEHGLIAATKTGEIFYISFKNLRVWDKSKEPPAIKVKKLELVFEMKDPLRTMCICESEEEGLVFVGGDCGIVYALSLNSHFLVKKLNVTQSKITAIDCLACSNGDFVIAVGTATGQIIMIINWVESSRMFSCQSEITFIKFSPKGFYLIVGSKNGHIYRFKFEKDSFFPEKAEFLEESSKIQFEREIPMSLNFCLDFNIGVVETDALNYYKVNISEFKLDQGDSRSAKFSIPRIQLKNPIAKNNSVMPTLYDQELGFVIAGQQQGSLIAFETLHELKENSGSFYFGHSGPINEILINGELNKIFTVAQEDGTVFCWKMDLDIVEKTSGQKTLHHKRNKKLMKFNEYILSQASKNKKASDGLSYFQAIQDRLIRSGEMKKIADEESSTMVPSTHLKIEHVFGYNGLNNPFSLFYIHSHLNSQVISNELLAQNAHQVLNAEQFVNLQQIIIGKVPGTPIQKNNLTDDGSVFPSRDSTKPQNNVSNLNEPGIKKTGNKIRKGLDNNSADKMLWNELETNHDLESFLKKVSQADCHTQDSLPCFKTATICKKLLVYFVSRLAMVICVNDNGELSSQKIYQGHQRKISVLAIHSSHSVVATGEEGVEPFVHVWNPLKRTSLSVIKTQHQDRVKTLEFTVNGPYLISTSSGVTPSIQVVNWVQGRLEGFRLIAHHDPKELVVNKLDSRLFYTASETEICQWVFEASSIFLKKSFDITKHLANETIASIKFISYQLWNKVQKEIIALTHTGNFLVVRGSSIVHKASTGSELAFFKILVIRGQTFFFAISKDFILRVYDIEFSLYTNIDISECVKAERIQESICAFDVYQDQNSVALICGLSSGDIVEISLPDTLKDNFGDRKKKLNVQSSKIGQYNFLIKNHACVPKSLNFDGSSILTNSNVLIASSQIYPLIATIGQDQILKIWNSKTNKFIFSKKLSSKATVMQFIPHHDILLIGYSDKSLRFIRTGIASRMNLSAKADSESPHGQTPITQGIHSQLMKDNPSKDSEFKIEEKLVFTQQRDVIPFRIIIKNLTSENKSLTDSYLIAVSYTSLGFDKIEVRKEYPNVVFFPVKITEKEGLVLADSKGVNASDQKIENPKVNVFVQALDETVEPQKLDLFGRGRLVRAIHRMSFTQDNKYLYLSSQMIDQNLNLVAGSSFKSNFMHLETGQIGPYISQNSEDDIDDPKVAWQIIGKNSFFGEHNLADFDITEALEDFNQRVDVSVVCELGKTSNIILLGSDEGDIYAVRRSGLKATIGNRSLNQKNSSIIKQGQKESVNKSILAVKPDETNRIKRPEKDQKFSQSQRFLAHCSPITQIELGHSGNYLFTSSFGDECVIKWSLVGENDHLLKQKLDVLQSDEVFHETYPFAIFDKMLKYMYPQRNKLIPELYALDKSVKPVYKLEPFKIFGRKAFNSRSNIHLTQNGKLIYISGSALIILDIFEKKDSKSKSINLTLGFMKQQAGNDQINNQHAKQSVQNQTINQAGRNSVKTSKYSTVIGINDAIDNPARKNSSIDDKRFSNNNRHLKISEKSAESKFNTPNEKASMESRKIQKSEFSQLETDLREHSPSFGGIDSHLQTNNQNKLIEKHIQNSQHPSLIQADDKMQAQRDERGFTIRSTNFQAYQYSSIEGHSELAQGFLIPGSHYDAGLPAEVALAEISPDFNTVCIAMNGIKSLLGFWSVDVWSQKSHLNLELCSQVLILRFSNDSKYLVCIGITQKYTPVIYFIDVIRCSIIAYSEFSNFVSFRFKDVSFSPSNPLRFITVGMQHIASWKVTGELINFKELARSLTADILSTDPNTPDQNRGSTSKEKAPFDDDSYTVVKYLSRKIFVTGSTKGYVYIWDKKSYCSSYCAFENIPISCIELGSSEGELLISSCDKFLKRVIFDPVKKALKEESNALIEIMLGSVDIKENESEIDREGSQVHTVENLGSHQKNINLVFNSALQIQSLLTLENNNVLIGMRNGTMIIVNLNDSNDQKYLLDLFDDEKPSAVEFNQDSTEVYLLTKNGQFYAYNLASMQLTTKITTNKEGREILVVRDKVLLVMNKEIQIYDTTQGFSLVKEIRFNSPITKAKVSADQYYLYIVVSKEERDVQDDSERTAHYRISNCTHEIQAYEVENKKLSNHLSAKPLNQTIAVQQKDIFPLLWTYQTEEVTLFDLSEDGKYMLVQTIIGEILIFEIGAQNIQAFDKNYEDYEKLLRMKWMGEGITLSPDYSYLRTFYTKDNPVSSVIRLDDNCIAVADESGSVSLLDPSF